MKPITLTKKAFKLIEQLDIESSEIGGEADDCRALEKWTGQQGNDDPKIAEYV
jgi:hypothetical protein